MRASARSEAQHEGRSQRQRRSSTPSRSSRAPRCSTACATSCGLTGAHAGCEHGVCGACTVLIDGEPARSCLMFAVQADGYAITTIEGLAPAPGELSVVQDAFCETHGMQCGYCTPAMILTAHALLARNPSPSREDIVEAISGNVCRCTGYGQIVEAIELAAARVSRARTRPEDRRRAMSAPAKFQFLSRDRRVREDRRFVAGKGRYVADINRPDALHVALVHSPHPGREDRQRSTRSAALALPGVHHVLTGADLAAAVDPLMNGLDTPNVPPLSAGGRVRRATRANGSPPWSPTRARWPRTPPNWSRSNTSRCRSCIDAEEAYAPDSPPVHAEHGSNVLLDRTFVWGEVDEHFAQSPHHLRFRVTWGRNSTVPIETFGVLAAWDPWRETLDVWASIQMPKYADQIAARLRLPGNRRARALRRRRRRQLRRQARHQAHGARRLSLAPARPSGAADRGPAGEHARRRRARAGPHLRRRCRVRRRRDRALDEDARARQRRRLRGPLAVPARQADRRHRRALHDRERALPGDRR